MSTIEECIEVSVPLQTAYNQWTQFEEFPEFMEGVEEVRQVDDTHLHWRAKLGGVEREFDAEIVEQHPDQRIAWRTTEGTTHHGIVEFEPMGECDTRVRLYLETEPHGLVEKAGDVLGLPRKRVKEDLERFRELVERRGRASGAWRGEVEEGEVRSPEGRFR